MGVLKGSRGPHVVLGGAYRYIQAQNKHNKIMSRSFDVFDLMFLGSGGSSPSRFRGAPCSLLSLGGENFMFDAGEGSLRQLINAPYSSAETSRIFITHMSEQLTTHFRM